MTLKETLLNDMKIAMREKDEIRKNTVMMIRAAVLQFEKDNLTELNEEGIIEIISKELKKRKDALVEFEKSGRQDLTDNLKREIEIVSSYLPEQLSEEEVEKIVKETIAETGVTSLKEIGKIMSAVLPKVKGKADGKIVNKYVRQYLS